MFYIHILNPPPHPKPKPTPDPAKKSNQKPLIPHHQKELNQTHQRSKEIYSLERRFLI
jgi:hypothetical protein